MSELTLSDHIIGDELDFADTTRWNDARLLGELATFQGMLDAQTAPEEVLSDVQRVHKQLDFERSMRGLDVPAPTEFSIVVR